MHEEIPGFLRQSLQNVWSRGSCWSRTLCWIGAGNQGMCRVHVQSAVQGLRSDCDCAVIENSGVYGAVGSTGTMCWIVCYEWCRDLTKVQVRLCTTVVTTVHCSDSDCAMIENRPCIARGNSRIFGAVASTGLCAAIGAGNERKCREREIVQCVL